MRINSFNLKSAEQTPYLFADGELHNDPCALTAFFAGQAKPRRLRTSNNPNVRAYEKAKRLERMKARANKDRMRFAD